MATKVLIASTVLGSDAASITFSDIPQVGYDDLLLVVSARSSNGNMPGGSADFLKMALNATAMSSVRYLYGTGSVTGSATSPATVGYLTDNNTTASTFASIEVLIPNYTGAAAKSVSVTAVAENNATASSMMVAAGLYSTVTAAVTSLVLTTNNAANLVTGSSAYLYGIKRG
jgi:hypothetical protein